MNVVVSFCPVLDPVDPDASGKHDGLPLLQTSDADQQRKRVRA